MAWASENHQASIRAYVAPGGQTPGKERYQDQGNRFPSNQRSLGVVDMGEEMTFAHGVEIASHGVDDKRLGVLRTVRVYQFHFFAGLCVHH